MGILSICGPVSLQFIADPAPFMETRVSRAIQLGIVFY
jgi:hypothetical protein